MIIGGSPSRTFQEYSGDMQALNSFSTFFFLGTTRYTVGGGGGGGGVSFIAVLAMFIQGTPFENILGVFRGHAFKNILGTSLFVP